MKTQPLSKLLQSYGACDDAREWADAQDYAAAWESCERGDWLVWIAARVGVDRKALAWAACKCARLALRHVPKGEKRPLECIKTVERWCKGKATIEEVGESRKAAAASAAADAAADAAASAAASAAAYAAAAADAAADAAASAAASAAAYAAAVAATRRKVLKRCAVIVRKLIPFADVLAAHKRKRAEVA